MAWVSDDELLEELMKYGQKPGPIVDSTRGLYCRKLAQLRANETKSREKGEEEEEREAGVIEEPASSVKLWSNNFGEKNLGMKSQV